MDYKVVYEWVVVVVLIVVELGVVLGNIFFLYDFKSFIVKVVYVFGEV